MVKTQDCTVLSYDTMQSGRWFAGNTSEHVFIFRKAVQYVPPK